MIAFRSILVAPLQQAIALVCLFLVMGGPIISLQSYAWVKMIWERSETMGWAQAALDVASGEHPCDLCRVVESERERDAEHEGPLSIEDTKRAPVVLAEVLVMPPLKVRGATRFFGSAVWLWGRDELPEVPPPRWQRRHLS